MTRRNSLHAMSFNIRYSTPLDGPNRWERRREAVLQTVLESDPDVLGCQEVSPQQRDFLQSRLGAVYGCVGRGRNADGSGEQTPIFWKNELLQLQESWTFWLSPTPQVPGSRGWDALFPRTCTLARLVWREKPNNTLLVANTHLDHRGRRARRESVHVLLDLLRHLGRADEPQILLGDFNASERDAPVMLLRQSMQDVYRSHAPGARMRECGTYHAFLGPFFPNPPRIDYIFADPPAIVWDSGLVRVRGRHRGFPSDHYPVWARLGW